MNNLTKGDINIEKFSGCGCTDFCISTNRFLFGSQEAVSYSYEKLGQESDRMVIPRSGLTGIL